MATTSDKIIEIKNVCKSYDDKPVVKNLSLTIKRGEFVTLLGPSGCGKTTTLRMIAGFEQPTSGTILFNGQDITQLPPHKRNINTVFQKYALFPHLNVFGNIAFGLKLKTVPDGEPYVDKKGNTVQKMRNLTKAEIAEKVNNALKMVDLEDYGHRSVNSLSGGQQQRVAIARALVNEPQVLLLDEPLGALDLKMRKDMQLELMQMHKQLGITFVYVTHDQEEALTMSDRIVVMNKGVIEQDDNPDTIYHYPNTRFVAKFIGESNFFETESETLVIRPEKLNLCPEYEDEQAEKQHPEPGYYGTVVDVVFYGTIDKVFIRLDNSNQTVVAYQYFDDVKRWSPDERVGIWWYKKDEVKVSR